MYLVDGIKYMTNTRNIVVLGASPNPNRISYMATKLLHNKGYKLKAIGSRKGHIESIPLQSETDTMLEGVEAISIFLSPERQKRYYSYIIGLHPKAIIFNPGTENPELELMAAKKNIKVISCCTIALLAVDML